MVVAVAVAQMAAVVAEIDAAATVRMMIVVIVTATVKAG